MTVLQTGFRKSLIFRLFVIFLIGVQRLEPTLQALTFFPYCQAQFSIKQWGQLLQECLCNQSVCDLNEKKWTDQKKYSKESITRICVSWVEDGHWFIWIYSNHHCCATWTWQSVLFTKAPPPPPLMFKTALFLFCWPGPLSVATPKPL